jgi:hypothetical protein
MFNKHVSILFLLLTAAYVNAQTYTNPSISRVLVDPQTNYVHIYFTGTNHPDVDYYKISQWMITGNNPVSSGVPIESSITDHTGASSYHWTGYVEEVVSEPVGFTVGAYNHLGEPVNQSYPPDSTIHVTAEYNSCAASVHLRWNDYNKWRGNILQYQIIGSNTEGTFNVLATVHEGTNDTVITGLQASTEYLFYISAIRKNLDTDNIVTSNGVRFSVVHAYYPEFIHADFGTVGDGNHPDLQFTIDSLSELSHYRLYRSESPTGSFSLIDSMFTDDKTLLYTDNGADASDRPFYYKLSTINECGQPIQTSENLAGTVFLSGTASGNSVNLQWTAYHDWPAGVAVYDIQRSLSGGDYELLNETHLTAFSDNSFNNLAGQQISSEVCYQVTARENPGGEHSITPASSSSNTICIYLPMHIRFEYNAFAPGVTGFSIFGPTMDFLPAYFDFKIFNRTGNRVFESKDPANPNWDGKIEHGDYAPEGVYRYQLEYRDESGKLEVINGKVSVVRE